MKFLQIGESQSCFVRIRGRVTLCSAGKKIHVASIKDVRANCFYASLLRTQFTGTSCIERAPLHENKNIQEYSCLEYVIVTP